MNTKFKISYITGLFLILFSSCLKHDDYILNLNSGTPNNAIYFMRTGLDVSATGSQFPRYDINMGVYKANLKDTFNINVIYGGADVAPQDITVTFSVVDSVLNQFNRENNTDYEMPPRSVFSIPDTIVTIKKGTQMVTVQAVLTVSADYDYLASYAIPLKIISSSSGAISSNLGTAVYSFGGANIYDGSYSVTGTFTDLTDATNIGKYPKTIYLITAGLNSVIYNDPNLTAVSGYGYTFLSGGTSSSYFGNFDPVFTFDNNGNIVSVANYYGDTNPQQRTAGLDPSGVNKITFAADGVTPVSMQVSYFMYQAGALRLEISENFTYRARR